MDDKKIRFQIETTKEIKDHLKTLAYSEGKTLTEFFYEAIQDCGDKKLKVLIQKYLANK